MAITNASFKPAQCPEDVVAYNNHAFIGRELTTQQFLGWDYRTFVFDVLNQEVEVHFSDDNGNFGTTVGASTLSDLGAKIVNDAFGSFVGSTGNTTTLAYTVAGGFLYLYVVGTVNANLQITIRNSNTGVWADGSLDPENDLRDGRIPSFFNVNSNLGDCEVIEVGNDTYNCATDQVLVKKTGSSFIVNGNVFGWSQPEATSWSNEPAFISGASYQLFIDIDTDGLGSLTYTLPATTYTNFSDIISWLNAQLIAYGSSYRLLGATDNRIFLTQTDGTTVIAGNTDPYFIAHTYTKIVLELYNIGTTDYLVKGQSASGFSVSNVQVTSGGNGGLVWSNLPCSSPSLPALNWEVVNPSNLNNPLHTGIESTVDTGNGLGVSLGRAIYAVPQMPLVDQSLIDSGTLYIQYGKLGERRRSKWAANIQYKPSRIRWYNPFPNTFNGSGFLGGTIHPNVAGNNPGLIIPNLIPVTVQRQKITEPLPYWSFYGAKSVILSTGDMGSPMQPVTVVTLNGSYKRKTQQATSFLPGGSSYRRRITLPGLVSKTMVDSTWYCRLVVIVDGKLVATGPISEALHVSPTKLGFNEEFMTGYVRVNNLGGVTLANSYTFKGWDVRIENKAHL